MSQLIVDEANGLEAVISGNCDEIAFYAHGTNQLGDL